MRKEVHETDKKSLQKLEEMTLHDFDYLTDKQTLYAWNSLHAPKKKVKYYGISLTCGYNQLIDKLPQITEKWAYIKHDKDEGAVSHYHFYLEFPSARWAGSVANECEVPVSQLEFIHSKKGFLQYLTHENNPEKYHYEVGSIISSFDVGDEIAIQKQISEPDVLQEFDDYCAMREGRMTKREFIDKYQIYIVRHSFSNRMQVYNRSYEAENSAVNSEPFRAGVGRGLSSQRQMPKSKGLADP